MLCFDMIWCHLIWYGLIWFDMVRYGSIWNYKIWYDVKLYNMIWYDIISYRMIRYDTIQYHTIHMIRYDTIWNLFHFIHTIIYSYLSYKDVQLANWALYLESCLQISPGYTYIIAIHSFRLICGQISLWGGFFTLR